MPWQPNTPGSGGPVRRRATAIAWALAATMFSGVLTDLVACAQVLAMGGPDLLLVLYPVCGVGLAIPALLLVPVVDRWPRLTMLRVVGLVMSASMAVVLVGYAVAGQQWPDSSLPVAAMGAAWVFSGVQVTLMPMLIWSLAGDVLTVAQSRTVNGRIAAWTTLARIAAFAVAVVSPPVMTAMGVPLTWLLAIPPTVGAAVAIWLPRRMRGEGASAGVAHVQGARDSVLAGWRFFRDVPVWSWLLVGSVLTLTAGYAMSLGISAASEIIIGADAAHLQVFLGATQLLAAVVAVVVARYADARVSRRFGVNGALLVLPVCVVVGAVLLAVSLVTASLVTLAAATLLWRVPLWGTDQSARAQALGLVPDQRRARVALVLVLVTCLTWVLAAPVAAPGLLTGWSWLLGVVPAGVGSVALVWWVRFHRAWDDSMLNWRLRRRKRSAPLPHTEW